MRPGAMKGFDKLFEYRETVNEKTGAVTDAGFYRKGESRSINSAVRKVFNEYPITLTLSERLWTVAEGERHSLERIQKSSQTGLDFDVPIVRSRGEDKLAYMVDTKLSTRGSYGQYPNVVNQVLKYQQAIEQGAIAGATIVVEGRIDPAFMAWAAGIDMSTRGEIPDVEIMYKLPLPGGQSYYFPLKMTELGKGTEGLKLANEGPYRGSDQKLILGLRQAIFDRSFYNILTDIDPKDFPKLTEKLGEEEALKTLANPKRIESVELLEIYEEERVRGIWKSLKNKYDEYLHNKGGGVTAYDDRVDRNYVTEVLRKKQQELRSNPELAKVKQAYLIDPEEEDTLVDDIMQRIELIRAHENERQEFEEFEAQGRDIQVERERMGWSTELPESGIPLDIPHIIDDAIHNHTKTASGGRPRVYGQLERFVQTPEELLEKLRKLPSQRYIEFEIFDPLALEGSRLHIRKQPGKAGGEVSEKKVLDWEDEMRRENISRLEDLRQKQSPQSHSRQLARIDEQTSLLKAEQGKLMAVEKKKLSELGRKPGKEDFKAIQELSRSFTERFRALEREQEAVLVSAVGGETAANRVRIRLQSVRDQEVAKFIYVITSDNQPVLEHEVIRATPEQSAGRAAHSELLQGRNNYGAGELKLSRFDKSFDCFEDWYDWNNSIELEELPYVVEEINNGSGHYRPVSLTNQFAANVMTNFLEAYNDLPESELHRLVIPDSGLPRRDCYATGADLSSLKNVF